MRKPSRVFLACSPEKAQNYALKFIKKYLNDSEVSRTMSIF